MGAFTFIDLFAGIGGFRQALTSIGGQCIGFSEIASDAISAYCANYNETPQQNFGDIRKIEQLPPHDIMTAGVPCQSWSIAGKNLGFDDDRGQLWNDTLYLLNASKPKAFIFENVKGLSDPRNRNALSYILSRIKDAGYYAKVNIINSFDYGVPQNRVRIYIIGFKEKVFYDRWTLPASSSVRMRLADVLDGVDSQGIATVSTQTAGWSLSTNEQGFNDYFLFNDLRNGHTTIHSWDIIETTDKEKSICNILLANRRKKIYGDLDGNPLSLQHLQSLDNSITIEEIENLIQKGIFKRISYLYELVDVTAISTEAEAVIASKATNGRINIDKIKTDRQLKMKKISATDTLNAMETKGIVRCIEERYDFKHGKISTGLYGINRIFLPSSCIYPTLVASDTNDFVTTVPITADSIEEYRKFFINEIYRKKKFRQITKEEACRIQGFPEDFMLPDSRARWMKLIGNSVSVPVIKVIARSIAQTGVFGPLWDESDYPDSNFDNLPKPTEGIQMSLF